MNSISTKRALTVASVGALLTIPLPAIFGIIPLMLSVAVVDLVQHGSIDWSRSTENNRFCYFIFIIIYYLFIAFAAELLKLKKYWPRITFILVIHSVITFAILVWAVTGSW